MAEKGVNEGLKPGMELGGRTLTKKELDIANQLGLSVLMVKEDEVHGTGVVMVLTDLKALKDRCASHRSWTPTFFRISANGTTVSIAGSGYNKKAPALKQESGKANVL